MRGKILRLVSPLLLIWSAMPAAAQTSRVMVDQIGDRRSSPARNVPTRPAGDRLASDNRSGGAAPSPTEALSSDLLAACQAGVAPPGIRCPRGLVGAGPTRPPGTAEGTLLQIFGVPENFTTTGGAASPTPARSGDAVAQEVAGAGNEGNLSNEAAGAVARQRPDSPPPSNPR